MSAPAEASGLIRVAIPSLELPEGELMAALRSSIYPGAEDASIKLVIAYCRAAQLDPLQRPVHIVPMNVKRKNRDTGRDEYVWMDVILPGIGLYRTQAARSGLYAGLSDPEFGPERTLKVDAFEMTYPETCRVVAYRLHPQSGKVFEFPATERWIENYAAASKDSLVPNTMWRRRIYGQLAKCAEAQALRKAFPEIVGAQYTAEEMTGQAVDVDDLPTGAVGATVRKDAPIEPPQRVLENDASPTATFVDVAAKDVVPTPAPPAPPPPATAVQAPAQGELVPPGSDDSPLVGVGERAYVTNKAVALHLDLPQLLAQFGVAKIEELRRATFDKMRADLMTREASK